MSAEKKYHLWYFQSPHGNFGDDYNLDLWMHLGVEVKCMSRGQDVRGDDILVGVGSILNTEIPIGKNIIVAGSGYGYGIPPAVTDRWKILAVRGPFTAEILGIDSSYAITDPGIIVGDVYPDVIGVDRVNDVSFLPHYKSAIRCPWSEICKQLSIKYIDPRQSPYSVAKDIASSNVLLTESLHGAIFADSLRTPWSSVVFAGHINDFKWRDWSASMNLSYNPIRANRTLDILGRFERRISKTTIARRMWGCHILSETLDQAEYVLSDDVILKNNKDRLIQAFSYLG